MFVIIASVLIVLILWHGKKLPMETPLATLTTTNIASPTVTPTPSAPAASASILHTNAPAVKTVTPTGTSPSLVENKEQRTAEILSTANNVPIVFYGRLVDQFSNPVVEAEIAGTTTIISGVATGANRFAAISDGNGFFRLNASNGQSLGIMPKKAGYALATTGTEFNYSHLNEGYYVPDQNNPTIIKMWKLQGTEPLINIDRKYKLHDTDVPIYFDLLTGKIVPTGGDLKITVIRPPGVVSLRSRQDWSLQIESVEGGLIETSIGEARVTYAAPESGYQPTDAFLFSTNAPHKWFGGFDQMFFISSRSGQVYSKVFLSFNMNRNPDDPMSLSLRGVANANNSRNLEGDANTMQSAGQ